MRRINHPERETAAPAGHTRADTATRGIQLRSVGVPSTLPREALPGEVDTTLGQSGYANEVLMDGGSIELDSVVAFTIRTP